MHEMTTPVEQHRFAGVDWDDVVARLTAEAVMLCRGADVVLRGVGVSPEDLVSDTMAKLFEDETVRYRKDRGPLLPFLKTVMRRDFYDLKKRSAYRTTVIVASQSPGEDPDDVVATHLDGFAGQTPDQEDFLYRRYVMEQVGHDPKLKDQVAAALEFGCFRPADVADLLATTVDDVENRRRRLRRRLNQDDPILRGTKR